MIVKMVKIVMTKYKKYSRCFLPVLVAILVSLVLSDTQADLIYYESDGVVVGEAELFSSRNHHISGSVTNGWFIVPEEDAGAGFPCRTNRR
ncbi:MAG: hypothetical protein PF904_15635 [Kiritimatiellae bacterium]|jgi:hypothetical protein|nr:hypothetical protein [Kiritimatiellia bacterium]